ncbi:MAG: diphosphomevalonate decarboxylase [Breznakibacter sp.]
MREGQHYLQTQGVVQWSTPSNIAIVKYWGKKGVQEPLNPSVSFSLQKARTLTRVEFEHRGISNNPSVELWLDGQPMPSFQPKISKFLIHLTPFFPWVNHFHLRIDTHNTFPHSSGIASSASGMACLAFCLAEMGTLIQASAPAVSSLLVSGIARLGSGSACRSVHGGWNLWGKTDALAGSSDTFSVPVTNVSPAFQSIQDTILILKSGQKRLSSSDGHQLMETHPYRDSRIAQANGHTRQLLEALATDDWATFGQIAESEALSLHALMVNSRDGYTLLAESSWEAIYRVRDFRRSTGIPVYFTFDAGPNMHLLYPEAHLKRVDEFVQDQLLPLCENNTCIEDHIGAGPKKLNKETSLYTQAL